MKCEIVFEARPTLGAMFAPSQAYVVCRTHGVTIEGYQNGPLCLVGRLERIEKSLGLDASAPMEEAKS